MNLALRSPVRLLLLGLGLALSLVGVIEIFRGSAALAGLALLCGVGLVILGAFYPYIDSWHISWKGIGGKLYEQPHGKEFAEAASAAPDSALAAVIPLLREDVSSDVITVPASFDGNRLIDPELGFIRQELGVTVFALRRPGDTKWCGGGRVSTTILGKATELAVLGEPADIERLRQRFKEA